MKTFFADTNIWLRLLIGDVPEQQAEAERQVKLAKVGKIRLVLCSEVVMEVVFVLDRFYGKSREEIARVLTLLLKTEYLDVPEREVLINTMELYGRTKLDWVDLLLYSRAKEAGAEVLTFDEELRGVGV